MQLAGDRIELTHVFVAEPEQPDRAVDGALHDLRTAQVGKVELGVELRVAQDVGDLRARSGELVLDLEVHATSIPERAGVTSAMARRPHFATKTWWWTVSGRSSRSRIAIGEIGS